MDLNNLIRGACRWGRLPAAAVMLLWVGMGDGLAADWTGALPAPAVQSYLVGQGLRILVAGGGDPVAPAKEAARALAAALQGGPQVKLVMDDGALGDLTGLDDSAIVAKAKKFPVDQVFVVRVFPAGGDDSSAVVTMYTLDGGTVGALTAATNEPLVAQSPGAGQGLTGAAAAAVSSVSGSSQADFNARREQYELRRVWFQGYAAISGDTGKVLSTWSVPYKGKYEEPLKVDEFYSYVGREDLAATAHKRLGTRRALGYGAVAGLLVGAAGAWPLYKGATYTGLDCVSGDGDDADDCLEEGEARATSNLRLGIGLTAAGFGTTVVLQSVAFRINPHPVSVPERYQLADEFNKRLRDELGLSDGGSGGPSPVRAELSGSLGVGPGSVWLEGKVAF